VSIGNTLLRLGNSSIDRLLKQRLFAMRLWKPTASFETKAVF
jgi:hypothetical protein